jgi:presenilin-like A22 family membrane protease
MKHSLRIAILLLVMFLLTQIIGVYVVDFYSNTKIIDGEIQNVSAPSLPYGMQTSEEANVKCNLDSFSDFFKCTHYLYFLIIAFVIAIALLFLLTKFKTKFIMKFWFFIVVVIALGIFFTSVLSNSIGSKASLIALILSLPLAYVKIYKKEFIIHNITEFLIYPGIAAVFVPILNYITIIILLILISIYDVWAVFYSGIMQKMAKYQIDKLHVFSGFFVPYADDKTRVKIKEWTEKYKKKKISKKKFKSQRFRINIAILGGGDIVFPIITAGVMLKTLGLYSAFFVIAGATLGLTYLFFFSKKKKFYPAMPFITAGIFIGMIAFKLIF